MTFYNNSPEAELAMTRSLTTLYEYRWIILDMIAAFLGYMAWQNYKDFNSTEADTWTMIQLNYETAYYIHRTYLDYNKWRAVHHVLCLGYLYWGWAFKTALSTAFYFSALSNCFMGLMQKHPNKFTKISFAISFFISRILYGTWIMWKTSRLPVHGSQVAIIPMTWTIYFMQWWWFWRIALHVKKAFKVTDGLTVNGGDAPQ